MRLKIAHVLSNLGTYGAQRVVADLLPELRLAGCDVAALTVYEVSEECRTSLAGMVTPLNRRRGDFSFFSRMVSFLRDWQPDVVHTHTHNGKYWGRAAAILAGCPAVVHTEHNPTRTERPWPERLGDAVLDPRTDAAVVFSHEQRCFYERRSPGLRGRIRVIPNGVRLSQPASELERARARRALGIPSHAFVICMLGRLETPKNNALALRALHALVQRDVHPFILFVGDGPDQRRLRALAAELHLRDNVRFLGFRSDGRRILETCADALLLTSTYEGMPMSLLEAMACEVPVVSTPWTGVSHIVEPGTTGCVSSGWDEREIARDLQFLMDRPQRRVEMARLARARVEARFSLAATARAHYALYEELHNRRMKVRGAHRRHYQQIPV